MVIRFGIFELDDQSGELRRQGLKVRLPEQSFQILRMLLDRPNDVVTRDELRQRLWASDTSVDFDAGLNSTIRKLREALDDSADNPRFVETVPRHGYRFIGSARPVTVDEAPKPAAVDTAQLPARTSRAWIAGGVLVTILLAAMVVVYRTGWLERISGRTATEQIRSIAVLPFDNLTGDSSQEYFVDGITDALTTDLAEIGGFDVIARASAMQYKSAKKPLSDIGRELNVETLLSGAVARSGQRVRITTQLSDAATGRVTWAQSYDEELSDVIAIQRKIARAVAIAVEGRRGSPPPVRADARPAVSPAAYDAYLKGVAAGGRQGSDGIRRAVEYYEKAVAIQPDFAAAYAAMGDAQMQLLFGGPLSPREVIPKAEASTRKALQLDDRIARAHRTLGAIQASFYWNWDESDREHRRSRELNGNSGPRSELIREGRYAEAIADAERAQRLDPLSFGARVNVAVVCRTVGQYDRAVAELQRALELFPDQARGHFQLGATFMLMGRANDAIAELESSIGPGRTGNPRFSAYLGYAYAIAGRPVDARRILNELETLRRKQYVSSFGIALIHDALGEKEPALTALERAYEERAVEFSQMDQYPRFKTIESESRFQEVMRRVGSPTKKVPL